MNKIEDDIAYLSGKVIWADHIVKNEQNKNMTLQLAGELAETSNRMIQRLQEYERKASALKQDIDILKKAIRDSRKKKRTMESSKVES